MNTENTNTNSNAISDAEFKVLKELWHVPELTSRELIDRVLAKNDWGEATVKTLLLRLLKKKAVRRVRKDGLFLYSSAITEEEYRYSAGRSLLDRLFNGVAGEFLTCLVRHENLSEEEIQSLKKLLDKASKK